jgi:hypothetical protein
MVDGRTMVIEYRWAEGRTERYSEITVLTASNEAEIDAAFAKLAQQPGGALTIGTDTVLLQPAGSAGRARGPVYHTDNVLPPAVRAQRWPHHLWFNFHRRASHSGTIRRPNYRGREAERLTDTATKQVRAGN